MEILKNIYKTIFQPKRILYPSSSQEIVEFFNSIKVIQPDIVRHSIRFTRKIKRKKEALAN